MYRPRLSRSEVEFLCVALKAKIADVQMKIQRVQELEIELNELRELLNVAPYKAFKLGYKEKKAELERLKALNLQAQLTICEGLITRFQDMLNGKTRGRLKSKAELARLLLCLNGSKK
ncbi:hypothetical protein DRP04_04160 [Archaeoglobales archaeon]|nr:MAG: hypothetical protein DRP04_04160 [Archaeoglobales archaeon]